jgi:hypothetical protein
MELFQAQVMRNAGFPINPERPDTVKYEVAKAIGVDLKPGYNGKLSTEDAGKVGGRIGGAMVKEMIRLAQEQLARKQGS